MKKSVTIYLVCVAGEIVEGGGDRGRGENEKDLPHSPPPPPPTLVLPPLPRLRRPRRLPSIKGTQPGGVFRPPLENLVSIKAIAMKL